MRTAPEVLKDLVRQARESGIRADYLLFDSWFAFPATIIDLLEQKQQVICMLKAKTKYGYKGFDLTLKELYKNVRKRCGRAKILASVQVGWGKIPVNKLSWPRSSLSALATQKMAGLALDRRRSFR